MSVYKFSVVIERDLDGYFALCPELQGCYTHGDTYEEVLGNIKDVIQLHIEDRIENGEIPLCRMSDANYEKLRKVMLDYGLI